MLRLLVSFVGSSQTSRRSDMLNGGRDFWHVISTFGKISFPTSLFLTVS
jgi:hypothetical protein